MQFLDIERGFADGRTIGVSCSSAPLPRRKKLAERLENPHIPSAALSGAVNIYKIKLRQAGYRLVYSVEDHTVTVTVIAVGKRDRNEIYDLALSRLHHSQEP